MYDYSFNAFCEVLAQTFGTAMDREAIRDGSARQHAPEDRPGFLRFTGSLWPTRKD